MFMYIFEHSVMELLKILMGEQLSTNYALAVNKTHPLLKYYWNGVYLREETPS